MLFRKRKQWFSFGCFCWQIDKGRVDKYMYFTCVMFGDDKEREYSVIFQNKLCHIFLGHPCVQF